jgi:hypothetical protein
MHLMRFWVLSADRTFGPNVTTFVYPAEIFPVMVRTTGHGIAAAVGKVGAFIFPSCCTVSVCRQLWGLPASSR